MMKASTSLVAAILISCILNYVQGSYFNVTQYSEDYSCYHWLSWLLNDGYYNTLFSSKTNVVNSSYVPTARWRVTYTGIPGYQSVITAADITTLNDRPKASSDFLTGVTTAVVNQKVTFGDNIGYSSSSCSVGYWPPGPDCPAQYNGVSTFSLRPRPESSSVGCFASDQTGVFVSGAACFSWTDTRSYNDNGYWNNLAIKFEIYDLDICLGHSALGIYHHHSYSPCLQTALNDTGDQHSPIYAWSFDGYPIFGPYQDDNTLAISCWKIRNYTYGSPTGCNDSARSCVFKDEFNYTLGVTYLPSAQHGPLLNGTIVTQSGNTINTEAGIYYEDYYYDYNCPDNGDEYLNSYNGHDHGSYGFHYHTTIDSTGSPVFPYHVGPKYYGCGANACYADHKSTSTSSSTCGTGTSVTFANMKCRTGDFAFSTVASLSPATIPSLKPTGSPSYSRAPVINPTRVPTTGIPSSAPGTSAPTTVPSMHPTQAPSVAPTFAPSVSPSVAQPTITPSILPTITPTIIVTTSPSYSPSILPSRSPSGSPTATPSQSKSPTYFPSFVPSAVPSTVAPSAQPSVQPSRQPSAAPSVAPTRAPSYSQPPSFNPTQTPTQAPSYSQSPSRAPSAAPSYLPTSAELVAFDYDKGTGNLTLYFNEVIDLRSVNYTKIYLYSQENGYSTIGSTTVDNRFALTGIYRNRLGGRAAKSNSSAVSILLTSDDYAGLMYAGAFIDSNTSFVSLDYGAFYTITNQSVSGISGSTAMAVRSFFADNLPPFLISYKLNMNLGFLTLTFSEPIMVSSLTLSGLALQGSRNVKVADANRDQYVAFTEEDYSIAEVDNYNRTIEVQLGFFNLNAIKSALGLATNKERSWLSAWKPFVNDTAGNGISLIAFDMLNGIAPQRYLADTIGPYLLYWDLDMSHGSITLFFSETVYRPYFNFSGIQLFDGISTYLRVNEHPVNTTRNNHDIIRLTLNASQFEWLQLFDTFCVGENSSYLILDQGLVIDTAASRNKYSSSVATLANPMRVRRFSADKVRPKLTAFTLDLQANSMVLYFSKAISIASFKPKYITLQSTQNLRKGTEYIQLSAGTVTVLTKNDSTVIEMNILSEVTDKIQLFGYLGKAVRFTYIACSYKLVTDRAPLHNPIENILQSDALIVSSLVADNTAPVLSSWQINLQKNIMSFNFTRPVDISTLNNTQAFLSSEDLLLPSTLVLYLTNMVLISGQPRRTSNVQLLLDQRDVSYFKNTGSFCVSSETCYLTFTESFIGALEDYSGLLQPQFVSVEAVTFLQPSLFIASSTGPKLVNVTIDMNVRTVQLAFTEPIVVSSLDLTKVLAQTNVSTDSLGNSSLFSVALSQLSYVPFEVIDTNITIYLSLFDFVNIQLQFPLFTSLNTSAVMLEPQALNDVFANDNKNPYQSIDAFEMTEDYAPPRLIAVYLDTVYYENLTVYFDEAVDLNRIELSGFSLLSSSGQRYALTGSILIRPENLTDNAPSFTINLSPIKSTLTAGNVGLSQGTTSLFIPLLGAVQDASPQHNNISEMSIGGVVRDGLRFYSFRLDLYQGLIELEMPFYIGIASLTPSSLTLKSVSDGASYTLIDSTSYVINQVGGAGYSLQLTLSTSDRKGIETAINVSTASLVSLTIASLAMTDSNGKSLANSQTLICSYLRQDSLLPEIESFTLNLATGTLVLSLSKVIYESTVRADLNLFLYNAKTDATIGITLNNTVLITTGNISDTITLDLNYGNHISVREQILLLHPLATSASTTYLTATKGIAYDTAYPSNPTAGINTSNALQVSSLTLDNVRPTLLSYDLSLRSRILSLNFSEAINASTLLINYFTFGADIVDPSANYTLTSSSKPINYEPSNYIKVLLSDEDINAMMKLAKTLILQASQVYLSFLAGAFTDLATPGNKNSVIFYRYGIPVSNYVQDDTPPEVISYNISINDGSMSMVFSEVVDCQSFRLDRFYFQSDIFVGRNTENNVYLSNDSYCIGPVKYENNQNFVLGYADLMRIKATPRVLTSQTTSYLRLLDNAFTDAAGVGNDRIDDNYAIEAMSYVADSVQPVLLAVTVSTTSKLTLLFNEPMNVKQYDILQIGFQNAEYNATAAYNLIFAKLIRYNILRTKLEFIFLDDYYRIAHNSFIYTTQALTWFTAQSSFISDMQGNALIGHDDQHAKQVGPSIIFWDIDANNGQLQLGFSELVNMSIILQRVTVHNGVDISRSNISYSFLRNTIFVQNDTTVYSTYLSTEDINNLKLVKLLRPGLSAYGLYLSAEFAVTRSIEPSDLVKPLDSVVISTSQPLQVRYYVPDITSPTCISFDINLDTNKVNLHFSEAVQPAMVTIKSITLVSSIDGRFLTLISQNSTYTVVNQTTLEIKLQNVDLVRLKSTFYYANGLDQLIIQNNAVYDFYGNGLIGNTDETPIAINTVIYDLTPPTLTKFTVDLSTFILKLTFDDVILAKDFSPENIFLFLNSSVNYDVTMLDNATYLSINHIIQLSNYTLINQTSSLKSINLDLNFLRIDKFRAQQLSSYLLKDKNTSYIGVRNAMDIFGNVASGLEIIQAHSVLQVSSTTLEGFDVESVSGSITQVTLYFSNLIDISTFSCVDFVLQSASSGGSTVTLADSDCSVSTVTNSQVVAYTFATSLSSFSLTSTVYLSILSTPITTTKDIYGNSMTSISTSSALPNGANLLRVSVDFTNAQSEILLVFSKNIRPNSLANISFISFYSSVSASTHYLNSDTEVYEITSYGQLTNDSVVILTISTSDTNKLKLLDITSGSFYVSLQAATFTDDLLIANNKITNLFVERILPDVTNPMLANFTLDLGTEQLMLVFNEPIRSSSVIITNLFLQDTAYKSSFDEIGIYRLTGGTYTNDFLTLTVQLSAHDAANIKMNEMIGKDANSTYLSYTFGTAVDYNNNPLEVIPLSNAQRVSMFVNDSIAPTLDSIKLDFSSANSIYLTMNFSEPVLTDSFNVTQVVLQSRFLSSTGVFYRLTGGTLLTTTVASAVLVLQLSDYDVLQIKLLNGLLRAKTSSFLRQDRLVTDVSGNYLTIIEDGFALLCNEYIADLQPPVIIMSSVDWNQGLITLTFNEPIILSSVKAQYLEVLSERYTVDNRNEYKKYKLTSNSYALQNTTLSTVVVIVVDNDDRDSIKSLYPLFASRINSYFSFASLLLTDFVGNYIAAVNLANAIIATEYFQDDISPYITSYTLDMNKGEIQLSFSEAIRAKSLNLQEIFLQSTAEQRFGPYVDLNDSSYAFGTFAASKTLQITFSDELLNKMKGNGIGYDLESSYLMYTEKSMTDYALNKIVPAYDASVVGYSPKIPDELTPDAQAPQLLRWFYDNSSYTIHLRFDEPVVVTNTSLLSLEVLTGVYKDMIVPLFTRSKNWNSMNFGLDSFLRLSDYCVEQQQELGLFLGTNNTDTVIDDCSSGINFLKVVNYSSFDVGKIGLRVGLGAARDRSPSKNLLPATRRRQVLTMGTPDCSGCPNGVSYIIQNCTRSQDRICQSCSQCGFNQYHFTPCTSYQDASCADCKDCPRGQYINQACTKTSNTICKPCQQCSSTMQYTQRACGLGLDAICDSCEVCGGEDGQWASVQMKKHCLQDSSYRSWEAASCCANKAGKRVRCSDLLGYKGQAVDAQQIAARDAVQKEKESYVIPFLAAS